MQELLDSKYFVGPQNSKSLALDSLGLSRGTYKVLGVGLCQPALVGSTSKYYRGL